MVVTPSRAALALALGLLLAPLGAVAQQAEPAPEARLSDAWLSTLQQTEQRVVWSHAFALREETADALEAQRRRLAAELAPLILSALPNGQADLAAGLTQWRETLESIPALPARTPGRHDLPWLGANQRHDPMLSRIRLWGHCVAPAWVEVWHLGGVSRVTWRPGLDLKQALSGLPSAATRGAEQAVLITPAGERHTRGIAAWNRQATPLTPGSRIMLELPPHLGDTGGIGELINERLPAYLATRVPGEECSVHGTRGEE
ncbi:capsule biosynthesis GfcC family protein [Halomonas alimentaria]|uniref:capsule biosynthesis GfcC family protein n=1 Tax=Halomonas alimentaria TaxID=147248 RepID=UPI0024911F7F|nr:capsule biosynthesis GfcC family protein [Halomonas alimentaria]